MDCCTNRGLDQTFTPEVSRKDADRYRRKGLPPRARKLLKAIESRLPLKGKTTLEIGVGAGAVTIDMLRRGAVRATGVDAVAAQLAAARDLAADFDVADRVDFILSDFTAQPQVTNADVVVMDRVICCYADWRALLDSAAGHANQLLALTYPRDTWWMRIVGHAMNFSRWLIRSDFRFYLHSPEKMRELMRARGLEPAVVGRYFAWEIAIAQRS